MKDVLVLMGASRENGTMKEYLQQLKISNMDRRKLLDGSDAILLKVP